MTTFVLVAAVVLVLVLVALAAAVIRQRQAGGAPGTEEGFPYRLGPGLFTAAERSFLGVLDQAVGAQYRVFGKVRIADVATVAPMRDRSRWQRAFNRISAKHFDFVVCRADTLAVVCAIELDDKSHAEKQRQVRDDFLAKVCGAMSLPLLQLPAKHAYAIPELRERVMTAIAPVSAITASADAVAAPGQVPGGRTHP